MNRWKRFPLIVNRLNTLRRHSTSFCRRLNTVVQDLAEVPITRLKPGRNRKTLRYGWRRSYGKPIPFSRLGITANEDSNGEASSREDFVNALAAKHLENLPHQAQFWQQQQQDDPDSEAAQLQREEALERAAGKINLGPLLEQAPNMCSLCGEPIAGDDPRKHFVAVLQPHVGLEVSSIEPLETRCEVCSGVNATIPIQATEVVAEDDSVELLERLNSRERGVYQLRKQGLGQEEIGRRIGKSQETVSRILKNIDGKERELRAQRYRQTGA